MQNLGINLVKVENTHFQISYIENKGDVMDSMSPTSSLKIFNKMIYLEELTRRCDPIEKRVYDYLRDHTSNRNVPLEVSKVNLKTISLQKALYKASLCFAHHRSFSNYPNQIIMNKDTKEKYFENVKVYNLVINDYVPNNFIYLTHKGDPSSPGIAYYYATIDTFAGDVRYDIITTNCSSKDEYSIKLQIID